VVNCFLDIHFQKKSKVVEEEVITIDAMSSPTPQVRDMWGFRRGFELETLPEGRGI